MTAVAPGSPQTLEQRVEVVERELGLLKAQIQTILLEIQELILDGRYPSLHQQSGIAPHFAASQRPIRSFSLQPKPEGESESAETPAEDMPHVPPFTASPLPVSHPPPLVAQDDYEPAPANPPAEGHSATDVTRWIELDKWVSQKVKEVGIERTRQLVALCEGEEGTLLLKFVAIYSDCAEAQKPLPAAQPPPLPRETTRPAAVEPWQRDAQHVRSATYRPLGEHQELVLRLLAEVLRSPEAPPPVNGNGHVKR